VAEVNRLLDQFRDMQKMMKKVAASGGRNPFGRG
jgi:signal recognition particle GTPase